MLNRIARHYRIELLHRYKKKTLHNAAWAVLFFTNNALMRAIVCCCSTAYSCTDRHIRTQFTQLFRCSPFVYFRYSRYTLRHIKWKLSARIPYLVGAGTVHRYRYVVRLYISQMLQAIYTQNHFIYAHCVEWYVVTSATKYAIPHSFGTWLLLNTRFNISFWTSSNIIMSIGLLRDVSYVN